MRGLLTAVGTLLLALQLVAPAAAVDLVIVAFGDSITQGYPYITDPPNGARVGGYEPTLEALFAAEDLEALVHNHGSGGEHTGTGLVRLDGVLASFKELHAILILEGTNDLSVGTSPATVAFNLGVMVDRARAAGVLPVLGTIMPDRRPGRSKPIAATNDLIRQMAAEKLVPYCELHDAMAPEWGLWSDDLLHPNARGYVRLAEVWHACVSSVSLVPRPRAGEGGIGPAIDLLLNE